MDKIGLKNQYGHIKAAFAPATMICGAIGLSRDVFNLHQEKETPVKEEIKPSIPTVVPPSTTQNSINNYSDTGSINHSPSVHRPSRDHTPVTRPTASSPPGKTYDNRFIVISELSCNQ